MTVKMSSTLEYLENILISLDIVLNLLEGVSIPIRYDSEQRWCEHVANQFDNAPITYDSEQKWYEHVANLFDSN